MRGMLEWRLDCGGGVLYCTLLFDVYMAGWRLDGSDGGMGGMHTN
jgi:hypothetical protein